MLIDDATLLQIDVNTIIAWFTASFTEYWESVISIAITTAAVFVSAVTLWYQKKNYMETVKAEKEKVLLAGLAEAFRLLNDVKHREARKVLYNIRPGWAPSESSFNIIGIKEVTSKDESNQKALEDICKDIVKNDCNEIGVLAYYGLVEEEKFIEEGFWVILKVWDLLKDEIMVRRERDSSHHMKHLEDLRTKACEYAKKHDRKVYEDFCLGMAPIANKK
jgi:hypothetical protein